MGLAQTQRIGLDHASIGGFALGLVTGENHMSGFFAQDLGKDHIRRGHADTGVDHEQTDIGHIHGTLGQAAHPALEAVVGDLFQTGRVDHGKAQVGQFGRPFAQIAGHAGLVVDQRKAFADKAVEQRGFPDIGTAHDGKGKGHNSGSGPRLGQFRHAP